MQLLFDELSATRFFNNRFRLFADVALVATCVGHVVIVFIILSFLHLSFDPALSQPSMRTANVIRAGLQDVYLNMFVSPELHLVIFFINELTAHFVLLLVAPSHVLG